MTVRILRWATGCVAAASVVLLAGAIALAYADRHLVPASGWDFGSVVEEATFMVVPAVGFVLASRRPGNRVGWIFLGAGLVLGLGFFCQRYGQRGLVAAPGSLPAARAAAWFVNWALADPGRGIGVHTPALPDRAAVLAAMAPGRVVRGRGVHDGCGGPGGTRLPPMDGPVRCARCRVVSGIAYRDPDLGARRPTGRCRRGDGPVRPIVR